MYIHISHESITVILTILTQTGVVLYSALRVEFDLPFISTFRNVLTSVCSSNNTYYYLHIVLVK